MKTAVQRADELTAHIEKISVRQKARANLLKTLQNLDQIRELSDEGGQEGNAQPKDSNGIDSLDIHELDARENARIENLKRINLLSGALDEGDDADIAPPPARVDKALASATDINAKGKFGYTKMHQAVVAGDINEVRRLLELPGIDLSITDRSGSTPLDKAWASGEDEIAMLLGGTLVNADEN